MITGIAHSCYVVKDLVSSIDFYQKLGLTPAFDFLRDSGERFGVYLHAGGRNFIELFIDEPTEITGKPSYSHLCLEVDDIHTTVADLRAKGIEVSDPMMGCDNSWQAWVADPDGNRIELHHYTPESWQTPWLR